MPVLKSEIELDDGSKVYVRQASGMEKIRLESKQARVLRKFSHLGDPATWTQDQQLEFSDSLDEEGCGIADQIDAWLPNCILTEDVKIDELTTAEILKILTFVRGDSSEGSAAPLEQ